MEDVINKEIFSKEVEEYKYRLKLPYVEVILFLCDKFKIEVDDVPRLIDKKLKKNIEKESKALRLLKP